ncbi:sulfatase (plasmid) [Haloarcula hispanica N601]|uniref:Sulfatase n=2 Tax=Haloarcula hispanica TaxID=51589 RepID=V5TTY6_HALHI|nr:MULTISPECIES: sulfatase [Haloarcula]AEM59295.1 sulfatase [Haloarcula hispanica ATCC 33960]AHB68155.1 sulfatase [Haloarcula hispanica N601]AJF27528.1 sulfatase [Haloarcula sp. CBA1115]KAA9404505.1 sulfatase [Haloarcula sp. CBA1131]
MSTQPNIIWLTLDSVRADRTSMAPEARDTTPNMQRIANLADGQAFTNCITHAMWSLPSDASMLTGTYPSYHGTGLWNEVLPEEIPTVAERFSDLGYHTAGVSQNAYCSDSTGLSRGFDQFDLVNKSDFLSTVGVRTLLKYALKLRTHSGGYTLSTDQHRTDYLALDLAKRRLRSFQGSEEPFFMFVHTLGAHLPYAPPLSFRDTFTDTLEQTTDEAIETAVEVSSNHYRSTASGCDFSDRTDNALAAMYDGLMSYTDWYVGQFFEYLNSLDLGPTVFVVTGDHGDLLGEDDVLGHQLSLHDGLVNVPMVVHGLQSLADLPADTLLQHIDVMQALLLEAGASPDSLDGFQGQDPRADPRTYALSQRGNDTYETAITQMTEHDPTVDTDRYHSGLLHALRGKRFKFLQSEQGSQLYKLPDEQTDVLELYPSVAAEYRAAFEEAINRVGESQSTDTQRTMTDEMKDHLADLGYVTD